MHEETPFQPIICGISPHSGRLTAMQKAELIRAVDLFSHATVEELLRLAAIATEVRFSAEEIVFREGDTADALYLVCQGTVELTRSMRTDKELAGPCQAFGLLSVLTRESRYFTAKAVHDTFALRIDAEDFFDLLSHNMEIVVSIFRIFVRKVGGAVF